MARTLSLLPIFVLLLSLVSAQHTAKKDCAKGIHIIATSGYGGGDGYGGLLVGLVDDLQKKIPHSTSVSVPYDKGDYDHYKRAINGASNHTRHHILSYVESCPHTRIILLGYSAGAIATMNTICGASSKPFRKTRPIADHYANNIIATVVYGDESFTKGQPYNRGTCPMPSGQFPRKRTSCGAFAQHLRNYCDDGDDECCPPTNADDAHHQYAVKYDKQVMAFLMRRYKATINP